MKKNLDGSGSQLSSSSDPDPDLYWQDPDLDPSLHSICDEDHVYNAETEECDHKPCEENTVYDEETDTCIPVFVTNLENNNQWISDSPDDVREGINT